MAAQQILDQFGRPMERPKPTAEIGAMLDAAQRAARRINATYDAARTPADLQQYWANADDFSADAAHNREVRKTLVRRSRYETANNGYSDGGTQTYATDLVGVGPQLRMLTGSAGFNQLVQTKFWEWSKAVKFRRKLWCMAHAKDMDGEAFAVLRRNPRLRNPVKLDIVLYETEQCQSPYWETNSSGHLDGMWFDEYGNTYVYYFLHEHPGSGLPVDPEPEAVSADRVLHWFKMRRPGQHRGVPERASTLNLGAVFRRGREAQLSTWEKVSSWTLFLKTLFEPNEENQKSITPMSMMDIVHGMITALPNTVEPWQPKAEHPGPTYESFHKLTLNEQGRPKSMPFNKYACDSSAYNYASGRLDHQTYNGELDVDREDGTDEVLDKMFPVWFEFATIAYGWLGGDPTALSPAASYHVWDWPKHAIIDVEAEAKANKLKLQSGQIFIHRLYSDLGMDFEDEAASCSRALGIPVEEVKRRLFDALFPEKPQPGGNTGTPNQATAQMLIRLANRVDELRDAHSVFNGRLNGNGKANGHASHNGTNN